MRFVTLSVTLFLGSMWKTVAFCAHFIPYLIIFQILRFVLFVMIWPYKFLSLIHKLFYPHQRDCKFIDCINFNTSLFFIESSVYIWISRTTISQDVCKPDFLCAVGLCYIHSYLKKKVNFWGSAVSMILALY